jgi:hypothetical protein
MILSAKGIILFMSAASNGTIERVCRDEIASPNSDFSRQSLHSDPGISKTPAAQGPTATGSGLRVAASDPPGISNYDRLVIRFFNEPFIRHRDVR